MAVPYGSAVIAVIGAKGLNSEEVACKSLFPAPQSLAPSDRLHPIFPGKVTLPAPVTLPTSGAPLSLFHLRIIVAFGTA